ncbi:DUF5050 domain-containing protein [Clostridium bowmanii]|uniref:cell wall-binding repeat-containing protein n=1 Tax=Clostridium bowmanii TaxID=132925 RepID=UPI001CD6244E|nr:cell wall-binding repeat-containing protein [Clostridium bowmanii]MCA1075897.1 DUF5050 domain-containing protein [Clostridium bowmanii]
MGGNDVVSNGVASNFPNVQRLQGNDRFDTNVAVLNKFSQELDFESIYATTGNDYPDALAASALACKSKSPVCLVSNGSIDKLKGGIASKLQDTMEVKAIEQADVVSEDIVEELLQKYGNTNGNLKSGNYQSYTKQVGGYVTTQGAFDYYFFDGGERYSRIPSGLYKIKKDGTQSILLDREPNINQLHIKSNINVFGEWIYYEDVISTVDGEDDVKITEGIYKLKTDGTGKTKICSDNAREMMVIGDWIYYCNYTDKGNLYKIKVDGTNRTKIANDKCFRINFSGNYIYYLKYDDVGQSMMTINLYRIKFDGTDNMQIPCDDKILFLNVEGDFIYYSTYVDEKDHLKGVSIYKMKTDGTEKVKLCDTEYNYFSNSFNILIGNLYYWGVSKVENKSLETILYRISSDGKTQSTKFHGATINSWIVRNKVYYYTEDSIYKYIYKVNFDKLKQSFLPMK